MGVNLDKSSGVSLDQIRGFRSRLAGDATRGVMMNAVRKNGIQSVAMNHDAVVASQATFSNEVPTGAATNQKSSGRCWMFAGLNVLREKAAEALGLEEFELSQVYPMFFDKLEKANYFLDNILETRDEARNSRAVSWLLEAPVQDGGQWDMFVNLVEKYGVVPKDAMPETYHSSASRAMNRLLQAKLRENAMELRRMHEGGASLGDLERRKETMLGDVYRMLTVFLGDPPERFDLEYRDKTKTFHAHRDLTPQAFYERYVGADLREYVSVINAPTADKPFGKTYTVRFLGNVTGKEVRYLNVDIETMRALAVRQLLDGEPVWFGCDVGKMADRDSGVLSAALFDYEGVLGVPLRFDKAGRLDYGESLMTHAMVFTGVNLVDDRPNRWKVENSWGESAGKKGYFVMDDAWFAEFTYQVVVRKAYLPPELLTALDQKPIQLPPWDPMGALAL